MIQAARMYGAGIARTKGEAADMAGVPRATFYIQSSPLNGHPDVLRAMSEIQEMIQDKAVGMSAILIAAGRKAVGHIAGAMEDEGLHPALRLKAAIDLADRSPEATKVQKHQIEGLSIAGQDAQKLAEALVAGARITAEFGHEVVRDFVRVTADTSNAEETLLNGKQPGEITSQSPEVRRSDEVVESSGERPFQLVK
jgi:hypothetical protein